MGNLAGSNAIALPQALPALHPAPVCSSFGDLGCLGEARLRSYPLNLYG